MVVAIPALAQQMPANPLAAEIAGQRDFLANALAVAQVALRQKDADIAELKKKCGDRCAASDGDKR